MSVVIIDVLPNDVLVLEGARMVTFSGESYYAVLKGMVRSEDIGFGFKDGLRYRNIVSSQFIADAQIEFVSKGSFNDAQKESWYQRLHPFLILSDSEKLHHYIYHYVFILRCLASLDAARIKDLTDVRGSRSNQIRGYGIVTGLNGQGDSRIEYTELGILNALENFGIRADKADKSRNIAAVIVTANIGPFAKEGTRMDVTVSSIGNADSSKVGFCCRPHCLVQITKLHTQSHKEQFQWVDFLQVMLVGPMFRLIIQQSV